MKSEYEEAYALAEERHSWFVARRALFSSFAGDDRSTRILDVGCGTGMFLAHLKSLGFEHLAGVETSKNLRTRFRSQAIELFDELPERSYNKIFLLDVLEHVEDDRETLAELFERLEPGGRLYISVPAHPFLWSRHDDLNQHKRRYRKIELRHMLEAAGFSTLKLSYWNMFAFPAIFAARRLGLGGKTTDFDVGRPPHLRIYGFVLSIENWLVKRLSLPMGVSLMAIGEKR